MVVKRRLGGAANESESEMTIRTVPVILGVVLAVLGLNLQTASAQGNSFTYQGRLTDGGLPANGTYDVQFALYASGAGGQPLGAAPANRSVLVTNGGFTTTLDFGAGVFDGSDRWLELAVRAGGSAGGYVVMVPRQCITAAPYALRAAGVSGGVAAAQITGTLSPVQLPGSVITNFSSNVGLAGLFTGNFGGSFFGNGNGLGALNPASLLWGTAGINISGNAATATTANALAGQIEEAQLPANVARRDDPNVFTQTNRFAGMVIATNANNRLTGSFAGDGAGLSGMDLRTAFSAGALTWTTNWNLGAVTTLPAGNQPVWVTVADLNGDGSLDLAAVNQGDNSVSVYRNDGHGGFAAASQVLGAEAGANSVIAGDVNGDGNLDLVCANGAAGTLTVFTNTGHGGFAWAGRSSPGGNPCSLTLVDTEAGGRIRRLACGDLNAKTLTVFTNTGPGGFLVTAVFPVGNGPASGNPASVATADVNGDGRVDLVSGNSGLYSGSLTIITNDGRGGFALGNTVSAGDGAAGWEVITVTAADLRGTGAMDLISANIYAGTISVLLNGGGGSWLPPVVLTQCGTWDYCTPNSVAVVDVNGDGKLDLVAAGSTGLTVFFGDGYGGFTKGIAGTVGKSPCCLRAADLDGNGKLVLVCANTADKSLSLVRLGAPSYQAGFVGDGSGLATLNAGSITSGTLSLPRLPGEVVTNAAAGVSLTGTFSGDGSALTNLNLGAVADLTAQRLNIGRFNTLDGVNATIAGGINNHALGFAAAVGGGTGNAASADQSTVAGGAGNTASGHDAAVGGGYGNQAGGDGAFVGGGGYDGSTYAGNTASGSAATVAGGTQNAATGLKSTVGGGHDNQATNDYAVVPGGAWNLAAGVGSFAAGRAAKALHEGSFVWSDNWAQDFASSAPRQFLIRAEGGVGIGVTNPSAPLEVNGTVKAAAFGGTGVSPLTFLVNDQPALSLGAGGSLAMAGCTNTGVSSVALGWGTLAAFPYAVALGYGSTASNYYATALGDHTVATGQSATAMGQGTRATGDYSTSLGYGSLATGPASTAIGNGVTAAGLGALAVGTRAHAEHRGAFVWADSSPGDFYSQADDQFLIRAAGGVGINKDTPLTALDVNGTVSATSFRSSADVSFSGVITSAGLDARGSVNLNGHDLVIGQQTFGIYGLSYSDNVRPFGGMVVAGPVLFGPGGGGLGTALSSGPTNISLYWDATGAVTVRGNLTANQFNTASDRSLKEQFRAVNPEAVLDKVAQLPVTEWSFSANPAERHLGPTAQDFHAAFGLGPDDRHIATVDADGVALAAIKGLNQKLEARSRQLEAENAELKTRLERLEQALDRLAEARR